MRKTAVISGCLTVFLCCVLYRPAVADWINFSGAENAPNIAEVHIYDDHVELRLEVFVNDMMAFERLIPDEFFQGKGFQRLPAADRMRRFAQEDLQIVADNGQPLPATRKLVEPRYRKERPSPFAGKVNPYTRQVIPGPPKDKRVLYAEIIYPFDAKPASLTVVPPMDEKGEIEASIGFATYHNGVPVNDFRYLSEPSTVTLDWEDPWYSQFDRKVLKRWQQSGIMTFLYIEPFEVRHETLVRVKDMRAWLDLGLRGREFIEADEFEPLKEKIGAFMLEHSRVTIDGRQLRPILDRTSFVKYTMTRTYFIDQPEQMPLNTAMVGVIITYLTQAIPQQVTVDWDLFGERIQNIPATAVDPAGPFPSVITPEDPVLTWTNFLKTYQPPTVVAVALDESLTTLEVPLGSALCLLALAPLGVLFKRRKQTGQPTARLLAAAALLLAGSFALQPFLKIAVAKPAAMAPEMTDAEAVAVLESLLRNVYRSFDLREEEDVYDRLATSVSGDLLTDIYLQNRKSLVVTQAGGAQARVREVAIRGVEVSQSKDHPLGLVFRAQWTAMGTVGHWGHIHTRENLYDAEISVAPEAGVWKIKDLQLLDEKRIDPYADASS